MSFGSFALKSVASSNEANWRSITKGGTVQCLEGLQHCCLLRNLFPTMFYTRAHELRCNSYIHNDNERGCYTHTLLTKRSKSRCKHNKGCVTFVALPFTLKSILRQKKELWKLKYFMMQKYNLQKILQKKPNSIKILL